MGLFDKLKRKVKKEAAGEKKSRVVSVEAGGETAKKPETANPIALAPQGEVKPKVLGGQLSGKVILSPVVSEKSAAAEGAGVYTFRVNPKAGKYLVKEAIKTIYGITPKKIRVLNLEGKKTSFGHRSGKRADWKKAVITLPVGKTINIHEGV